MTDAAAPAPAYAGPRRILSGIQASGALHLGNYLGALKRFTQLQDTGAPCFLFVADLHAITVWQEPAQLAAQTREIAAAYLASGLDPQKAAIFPQSAVREHAELAWIFNCVARLGWLDRMTQFKEKSGKHKERSSVGLYTYPVLQAADILIYRATKVPVGDEDEGLHLVLQPGELHQGAEVVAQMQGAGRLDAGQHTVRAGIDGGGGGLVGHSGNASTVRSKAPSRGRSCRNR